MGHAGRRIPYLIVVRLRNTRQYERRKTLDYDGKQQNVKLFQRVVSRLAQPPHLAIPRLSSGLPPAPTLDHELPSMPSSMPTIQARRLPEGPSLGWLLGLSMGGAVLLLLAIGLLISWRVKIRRSQQSPGYGYTLSNLNPKRHTGLGPTKYQGLGSEYSGTTFSRRDSLSASSIQPPLPTHHGFIDLDDEEQSRGRPRERVWDEESSNKTGSRLSLRETWFCRDSWFSRTSDAMNLSEQRPLEAGEERQGETIEQEIHVLKRQNRTLLNPGTTVPAVMSPALVTSDDLNRGRSRVPAMGNVRPSVTDSDLRDVLRSIDERLKEGVTKSNTPQSSPTKRSLRGSPSKTILTSAQNSIPIGLIPPSPDTTKASTFSQAQLNRTSVESVNTAARSLLAKATREVEENESVSCYSYTSDDDSGEEPTQASSSWQPKQSNHQRANSLESTHSSTLSTLYSVGDEEEETTQLQPPPANTNDPFVTNLATRASITESTQKLHGPQSPTRLTPSLRISSMKAVVHHEETINWPLEPVAEIHDVSQRVNTVTEKSTLRTPTKISKRRPKVAFLLEDGDIVASTTSTPSSKSQTPVDTRIVLDDFEEGFDIADAGWRKSQANTTSPSPNHLMAKSVLNLEPSSAFDEQDILSALLSNTSTKRNLPELPSDAYAEENIVPVPLSPRPKTPQTHSKPFFAAPAPRRSSISSNTSSFYNDEWATESPHVKPVTSLSRQSTIQSVKEDSPGVANTVAELRRMNSVASTFSTNSKASTIIADPEPPGSCPRNSIAARSNSKGRNSISSRHYHSLASGSPKRRSVGKVNVVSHRRRTSTSQRRRNSDLGDAEKENQSLGMRGGESSGLRESGSGGNISRDSTLVGKANLGSKNDYGQDEWQDDCYADSPGSMGLYDADGFLKGTPDRSPKKRRHMRM